MTDPQSTILPQKRLAQLVYLFWIYTLLVIIWGAWVRISHSGNGCGDHWPLCHGDFIPNLSHKKTAVEYLHRIMSGLYGIFAIIIYLTVRKRPTSRLARTLATSVLVLTIIEALLGAVLVKQNLVTVNDSVFRLIMMSLHQVNSFLLTGSVYLLYRSLLKTEYLISKKVLTAFILVVTAGAIAALSNTLFPSESLLAGIQQDFQASAHLFVRLRFIHPALAVLFSLYIIYHGYKKENFVLVIKFMLAIVIGFITLLLHEAVAIKIIHLLIAHYLWSQILYENLKIKSSAL